MKRRVHSRNTHVSVLETCHTVSQHPKTLPNSFQQTITPKSVTFLNCNKQHTMGNSKRKYQEHERLADEDDARYFERITNRNLVKSHDTSIPNQTSSSSPKGQGHKTRLSPVSQAKTPRRRNSKRPEGSGSKLNVNIASPTNSTSKPKAKYFKLPSYIRNFRRSKPLKQSPSSSKSRKNGSSSRTSSTKKHSSRRLKQTSEAQQLSRRLENLDLAASPNTLQLVQSQQSSNPSQLSSSSIIRKLQRNELKEQRKANRKGAGYCTTTSHVSGRSGSVTSSKGMNSVGMKSITSSATFPTCLPSNRRNGHSSHNVPLVDYTTFFPRTRLERCIRRQIGEAVQSRGVIPGRRFVKSPRVARSPHARGPHPPDNDSPKTRIQAMFRRKRHSWRSGVTTGTFASWIWSRRNLRVVDPSGVLNCCGETLPFPPMRPHTW